MSLLLAVTARFQGCCVGKGKASKHSGFLETAVLYHPKVLLPDYGPGRVTVSGSAAGWQKLHPDSAFVSLQDAL